MATTLAAYDRGVDYSGLRPSLTGSNAPSRWGGKFVIRYSAGAGNHVEATQWKLCRPDEFRALVAAGYDVIANSEWYESRATEGAAAGKADGAADLAFWKSCGLAKGASIYVSWDEGQPDASKHDELAAYLRAYEQALGGYYHVDLYAGDVAIAAMLKAGVIRYGWRAMSDSWSDNGSFYMPGSGWKAEAAKVAKVSPAHIWQNGNRWYNGQADENVILRTPVGSHLEAGKSPQPGPKPKPVGPVPVVNPPAGVYEVRRGDTMSGIAAAHGMSLAQLEALNPHAGHPTGHFDVIWPGDKLKVKGAPKPKPAKPYHIVQPGDTLTGIAKGWGVSLAALERANPRAGHPAGTYDVIWPGDRIYHP